jgi:tungstate transport system permease protein
VTVKLVLDEFRTAIPLILHGNPYLMQIIGFTLQVAVVATAAAAVIGIPVGLAIGLGRFRGRRLVRVLANASLGVPPALVGAILFLLFAVQAPLGSLHLIFTRRAVFIAQTILALPYVVALTAAAIEGLPDGLLAQARSLGAIIAALGTSLSEVAAIAIVGGNIYGRDQTLASATLYEVNTGDYPEALAIAIVLILLIVVVMGSLGVLQHRGDGVRWRFRSAT